MKTKRLLSSILGAVPAILILSILHGRAGSFTTGNVTVTQFGNGSSALSSVATPVFVLEYLPSTANQPAPVQIITIPTNGPGELTVGGSAGIEGYLARSLNSSNLTFGGFQAPAGTPAVASSLTTNANFRVVGQLDGSGNFTTTAGGSQAFNGADIRAVISDGTNYWESGTGGSTTTNGGVWYSAAGAPPIIITNGNFRTVKIFNNTLYYSSASGTHVGVNILTNSASTVPTSKAAGLLAVGESLGGSPQDFAFNPAGNVCYIADGNTGIYKYTFTNGTSWTEAFILNTNNGVTSFYTNGVGYGCQAIAVDFNGTYPVLYATTTEPTNKLIAITDTTSLYATTDAVDRATVLGMASYTNTLTTFRGVALAPVNPSTAPPEITSISPLAFTNYASLGASITVSATGGTPMTFNWYQEIPGVSTNLVQSGPSAVLSFPSSTINETGYYQAVASNASSTQTSTSAVAQLVIVPGNPNDLTVSPTNIIDVAGQNAQFTASVAGSPPFTYLWYQVTATTTNLITTAMNPSASSPTLAISNVLDGNAGSYFAVVTNIFSPPATSSIVTLTVTNDPHIAVQSASAYGLLDGTVQLGVTAIGTAPLTYLWYFADANGNIIAPVAVPSPLVIADGNTNVITISDLQYNDLTNFVVVVTNVYGSVTSSVASLLGVNLSTTSDNAADTSDSILAFWDFNGPEFTNTSINPNCLLNPAPYIGFGSASTVGTCFDPGTSPFTATTTADPSDGPGFDQIIPGVDHLPDWAWGTENYPVNGTNKANGVQFNVSTVGAKNIKLTYDSRVSPTASDYERVQYTTNGTTWIDYPSSSSFNGVAGTGDGGWVSFANDLSGFPGIANNPNFAIRIVTEYQNTATYGVGTTNDWIGTANSYISGAVGNSAAGTVTYDLVGIYGDAITNGNVPPIISLFTNASTLQLVTNETTLDSIPVTNTFVVSGDSNPTNFTYSAASLNQSTVNPGFSIAASSNGVCTLIITPNPIGANIAAAPILVTVTDTNGDSTKAWFLLTLTSQFPAPTMSLTAIPETNTLINTALPIPFTVSSATDSVSQFTYSGSSDNNTVIPNGNIVVVNSPNPTNPTVTITPANNQLGVAVVNVTVEDHDSTEDKTTTASLPVMVRPNTNIVTIDYFNYDSPGALDNVSGGFWQHLSGIFHQMQVGGGFVTVDTLNNTENLQTPLIGAPYTANTLYYSLVVNMQDTGNMPVLNGTYFIAFNDGSGDTADVEDMLVAATNGAAPGYYRLGISDDVGANATNGDTVMFPQDLSPNSNYVVITALNVGTGQSTLWINPAGPYSPNVTAIPDGGTIVYPISDFELRESGSAAGAISVSSLKVGTTFLNGPQIGNSVTDAVPFGATWSISILSLSNAAAWSDPNGLSLTLSSVGPTSASGTNVTTDGVNIYYGGSITAPDSFSYIISDGLLMATNSVYFTVAASPQIGNSTVQINSHENPTFSGTGAPGYIYGIEDATNLLGQWFEAGNVTVSPAGTWNFMDVKQTNPPAIFYRVYYPDNPSNPPQ